MVEIKHRTTGEVIWIAEGDTLIGADLKNAKLSEANLYGVALTGANLSEAHLFRANLIDAELASADLSRASLSGANLSCADLTEGNLRSASLLKADLTGADLRGADLTYADLWGAVLYRTKLAGAKLNWDSHSLLAEVLRQAAGENWEARSVAGLVAVSADWCWATFLGLPIAQELRNWALDVLAPYAAVSKPPPELADALDKRAKEKRDE